MSNEKEIENLRAYIKRQFEFLEKDLVNEVRDTELAVLSKLSEIEEKKIE